MTPLFERLMRMTKIATALAAGGCLASLSGCAVNGHAPISGQHCDYVGLLGGCHVNGEDLEQQLFMMQHQTRYDNMVLQQQLFFAR